MKDFNSYLDNLDYSLVKIYFMKREATYIPQKDFLFVRMKYHVCRMGRKRYIPIYIYWWRGWRTHCWIRFHQRVCMWLFFFNEKWLIVSKYSSHNRVFCIWNIPSWHYWILGNGYETQRFGRHVAESLFEWYMNDYLIHIVRLKYDTGTWWNVVLTWKK